MLPILDVNLTDGNITQLEIPKEWRELYIGGASLGVRMLWDILNQDVDPYSEANPLLFISGPLTGTAGPAVGRLVVCSRSPATGLWGESNVGGHFGTALRKAGYDGLLIRGKAKKPVYLVIDGSEVLLRDGQSLWGKSNYMVQQMLRNELEGKGKGFSIASIGAAGEQKIPYALILVDHGRAAGRTGLGAVMGGKNLKAIAIRGKENIPVYSDDYHTLRSRVNRELRDDNLSRATRELGTAGGADYFDYLGEMPKKYFSSGTFSGASKVSGSSMTETILAGVSACHGCVIACGRVVDLGDGVKRKGPEYETIVGFGPNLEIDDLAFITRMGELCDEYGVDSISLSNSVGLALRMIELGAIPPEDLPEINRGIWGNQALVEQLCQMTLRQEGVGYWIARGAAALEEHYHLSGEAIQVKGLEVPYHDPRAASGMALSYATSPRGACHNQSDYFMVDILGNVEEGLGMQYFDRHAGVEKVENVIIHQNWRSLQNSLVMCFFANVPSDDVRLLIEKATGFSYSLEDLLRVGERAWNLKRLLNYKLGASMARDVLPAPLLRPYQDGGAAGYRIPFDEMLTHYYELRGWEITTGVPQKPVLKTLGLDKLAKEVL